MQDSAARRHMALPLAVALDYLADGLDAGVPPVVRDRLATHALRDPGLGAGLALHGARTAAGGLPALVRRTPGVRARIAIAHHVLLPSLEVLWWTTQPRAQSLRETHGRAFRVARRVARGLRR